MTTSNVIPLTDAEFRRRCSKMSDEIFGVSFEIEAEKQQIISDAMTLAHFLSVSEVTRFVNELQGKMNAIAKANKVKPA